MIIVILQLDAVIVSDVGLRNSLLLIPDFRPIGSQRSYGFLMRGGPNISRRPCREFVRKVFALYNTRGLKYRSSEGF